MSICLTTGSRGLSTGSLRWWGGSHSGHNEAQAPTPVIHAALRARDDVSQRLVLTDARTLPAFHPHSSEWSRNLSLQIPGQTGVGEA